MAGYKMGSDGKVLGEVDWLGGKGGSWLEVSYRIVEGTRPHF